MAGVMGSSVGSGYVVARTGRYKWMTVGAMAVGAFGLYLMTNLRAETDVATVWLWMFIAGLGIGPSFAVFTIVVQNAVAPRMLGAATSALTFFRQVGGSVGLAIAGTVFGSSFATEVPRQMSAEGIPQPLIDGVSRGGADAMQGELTGVGVDLGAQILAAVPESVRAAVEPYVEGIVGAIHQAFSLAIADTMWIALFGALAATLVVVAFVPERTLRHTPGPGAARQEAAEGGRGPIIPAME
jgi:hypothetical protein